MFCIASIAMSCVPVAFTTCTTPPNSKVQPSHKLRPFKAAISADSNQLQIFYTELLFQHSPMTNKNTPYFQIIEKKDLKFYKPLGIIDPQPKTTVISISIFVSFGIPYLTFHKAVSRPNQMRTYIMVQIFRTRPKFFILLLYMSSHKMPFYGIDNPRKE